MSSEDDARYRQRAADLDRHAGNGGDVAARLAEEKLARDNAHAEQIARQMRAEREG
jgi:hypothetical protein